MNRIKRIALAVVKMPIAFIGITFVFIAITLLNVAELAFCIVCKDESFPEIDITIGY